MHNLDVILTLTGCLRILGSYLRERAARGRAAAQPARALTLSRGTCPRSRGVRTGWT
jgi:hypothetical protein